MNRARLPDRRPCATTVGTFVTNVGVTFQFHVTVGFDPETRAAREVFLRPKGGKIKEGALLDCYGNDAGEMLSLLLQEGHTLKSLASSFKSNGLAEACVGWVARAEAEFQKDPSPWK